MSHESPVPDVEAARTRAHAHLARYRAPPGHTLVLRPDPVWTGPRGWVFVGDTARYLAGGDVRDRAIGLPPLLVERATGSIVPLPTGRPITDSLARLGT